MVGRLEPVFFAGFSACWLVAVLHHLRVLPLGGVFEPSLYQLYSLAAVVGWISGNVYVHRRRRVPPAYHRRLQLLWLVGPQGIPAAFWAMSLRELQAQAPFVPVYAFLVGAIFFGVPLVFGPAGVFGPKEESTGPRPRFSWRQEPEPGDEPDGDDGDGDRPTGS